MQHLYILILIVFGCLFQASAQEKLPLKDSLFSGDLKQSVIYFNYNSAALQQKAKVELDKIVAIMNQYPTLVIELGSFTDCSGDEKYNQILSEKRAMLSVNYIRSRITNPKRISGSGYGESKLVNGCNCEGEIISLCPDDENQLNRRTEFVVISK